jgi:hypothetical protein
MIIEGKLTSLYRLIDNSNSLYTTCLSISVNVRKLLTENNYKNKQNFFSFFR